MDRSPKGLLLSLAVAAASLGIIFTFWFTDWPMRRGPELLVHASAGVCLLWSVAATLIARRAGIRPMNNGTAPWPGTLSAPEAGQPAAVSGTEAARASMAADLVSVLQVASLATGLAAVITLLYAATIEALSRTVLYSFQPLPLIRIWTSGLVDLAAVGLALWLAWRRTQEAAAITAAFWVAVLAGLWSSLLVAPSVTLVTPGGLAWRTMSNWMSLLGLASALALTGFTWLGGMMDRRLRASAWPDRLELLTAPPMNWPGFRYSAGVTAVGVLILACLHLMTPWTVLSAMAAGFSVLVLAGRRWDENLADVGLALITAGIISLVMFPWTTTDYGIILSRAVFGLGLMTAFWYWVSKVWHQQLDNGVAWTTTGRLVRVSQRVGYLIGAAGALVATQLAVWPKSPMAGGLEMGPAAWLWGVGGNVVLVLGLLLGVRITQRATRAWLALFAVVALVAFVLVRLPHSAATRAMVLYWPLVLAVVAGGCLLLAQAAARSEKRRPFAEPLMLTGLLLAPAVAVIGVAPALTDHFSLPAWVPSITFAVLTGLYLLAARWPGPPAFVAVAIVCAALGTLQLRQIKLLMNVPAVFFYGVAACLTAGLIILLYRQRTRSNTSGS